MPFVQRTAGTIVGLFANRQDYAAEELADDHPDVLAYLNPPPPPPTLLPYQFRAMLKLSGKEAQLMAVLDALTEPAKTVALAKLEYSLKFHRDNDLVEQARQAMGLTTEALDKLWLQAAAIE